MPKRMLIDASHPEETRVVVLDGQKVEEFDFEAASKRPLKGNIYLAKVTRVEPSLQAAFVEYGGNRQGFLAFSEIHPDYYQIPIADRQALIEEQMAEARRRGEDEFEAVEMAKVGSGSASSSDDEEEEEATGADNAEETSEHDDEDNGEDIVRVRDTSDDEADSAEMDEEAEAGEHHATELAADIAEESGAPDQSANGDTRPAQALQAQRPTQRWVRKRHYKIQEVIKRRQIMLIQVVKEERGNKGAALTTYLSLAGRYCVLMPNTPRGGGISRKITNAVDRKRLKMAAASLELPDGMGLIVRTAGANRTKLEIKRDYEYLLRMWDSIRELTLKSNAPACVYEEGDLVKRAIRDLYNKDVSEVIVEGEEGYRNAKDFMRMLMPSHAKNVKPYKETVPLYHRHHIEAQLDAMFSNTVTLKSGGYIVINQTEALVAIDVNSGRATREHNIEDTAYKTNLEAAEEISRQLRLRDLAGLIVIDFIDMEDGRNDRNVEKRLRDCVKNDRARIQIGKISQFGLLEMSRQRLRAGVIAGSTVPCPHCAGQGIVRSTESTALRVLRGLEEEGQKQRAGAVSIRVPSDVAIYTLNQKRRELMRIETDYGMAIAFAPDETVTPGNFEIDRTQMRSAEDRTERMAKLAISYESTAVEAEEPEIVEEEEVERVVEERVQPSQQASEGNGGGRKRRRRRRGRDHERGAEPAVLQETVPNEGETEFDAERAAEEPRTQAEPIPVAASGEEGEGRRKRRRRRRGRRGRKDNGSETAGEASALSGEQDGDEADGVEDDGEEGSPDVEAVKIPIVTTTEPLFTQTVMPNAASTPQWSLIEPAPVTPQAVPEPQRTQATPETAAPAAEPAPLAANGHGEAEEAPSAVQESEPAAMPQAGAETAGPARKGWWQRPFLNRE